MAPLTVSSYPDAGVDDNPNSLEAQARMQYGMYILRPGDVVNVLECPAVQVARLFDSGELQGYKIKDRRQIFAWSVAVHLMENGKPLDSLNQFVTSNPQEVPDLETMRSNDEIGTGEIAKLFRLEAQTIQRLCKDHNPDLGEQSPGLPSHGTRNRRTVKSSDLVKYLWKNDLQILADLLDTHIPLPSYAMMVPDVRQRNIAVFATALEAAALNTHFQSPLDRETLWHASNLSDVLQLLGQVRCDVLAITESALHSTDGGLGTLLDDVAKQNGAPASIVYAAVDEYGFDALGTAGGRVELTHGTQTNMEHVKNAIRRLLQTSP